LKNKKQKKGKGSILVGVILMFILISSIALAVINRSMHGAILTADSKKGYNAYQASDSNTEKILNNIKKLDNDNTGAIPENTSANSDVACGGNFCYKTEDLATSADKVSDIFFIKKSGESQATMRSIFAPASERVTNPVSNLAVAPNSPNRCDAKLTWNSDDSLGSKISELEVRKNVSSNLLNSAGWTRPAPPNSAVAYPAVTQKIIGNSEFAYGQTYHFSIKAKNKNPLALDSLYYSNPVSFTAPAGSNCSGGQRVGCLPAAPAGSSISVNPYTCCGGTECYECNAGWDVSGSSCVAPCMDECSPSGKQECVDGSNTKTCGNYDGDSCLEWGDFTSCSGATPQCIWGMCCISTAGNWVNPNIQLCSDRPGPTGLTCYYQMVQCFGSLSVPQRIGPCLYEGAVPSC
jgi:hypothetical protein